VRCSVLQSVAECCRVLQSIAECGSVLQCDAVCCSVLQQFGYSVLVWCVVFGVYVNSLWIFICCLFVRADTTISATLIWFGV